MFDGSPGQGVCVMFKHTDATPCPCIARWQRTAASTVFGLVRDMVGDHPEPERVRAELAHVETLDDNPCVHRGLE